MRVCGESEGRNANQVPNMGQGRDATDCGLAAAILDLRFFAAPNREPATAPVTYSDSSKKTFAAFSSLNNGGEQSTASKDNPDRKAGPVLPRDVAEEPCREADFGSDNLALWPASARYGESFD